MAEGVHEHGGLLHCRRSTEPSGADTGQPTEHVPPYRVVHRQDEHGGHALNDGYLI
jgi:hypothetical protein